MTLKEIQELYNMVSAFGPMFSVLLVIAVLAFKYRKFFKALNGFIRDWSGTSAEPGRPRVPGVMERLNEIDGALKKNGGTSIKDAVDRIEVRVGEIDNRLAEGDLKFDEIHNELKRIKIKKVK